MMPDNFIVTGTKSSAEAGFLRRRGATKESLLVAENMRLRQVCAQQENILARRDQALREGDHRIKKSLMIVSGLMALQESREPNLHTRAALKAAASRIRAIAQVHNALNLNGGVESVDLGALLQSMCESLHATLGDTCRIVVQLRAVPVEMPIRLAQPLLLAVNELVINALRHAFPGERAGAVYIEMTNVAGKLTIVVADNGVGLPQNYVDGVGFGLSLVKAIASQIGSSLKIESHLGARFTITTPEI